MIDPRSPYASILQQQMGPQGVGGGAQTVQARPMQKPQAPPQQAPQKGGDGGIGGMTGGMMSGLSDRHSKQEIQRLSSANDALSKALSQKVEYPNVNAPSSGLQALGQQDAVPPMQARFADAPEESPAANKVAAQNVALGPPPAAQGGAGASQPFNVSRGMPDLSALDEAYRRQGMGG